MKYHWWWGHLTSLSALGVAHNCVQMSPNSRQLPSGQNLYYQCARCPTLQKTRRHQIPALTFCCFLSRRSFWDLIFNKIPLEGAGFLQSSGHCQYTVWSCLVERQRENKKVYEIWRGPKFKCNSLYLTARAPGGGGLCTLLDACDSAGRILWHAGWWLLRQVSWFCDTGFWGELALILFLASRFRHSWVTIIFCFSFSTFSMNICIYVYMYMCIYVYVYICVYIYAHSYTYVYIHTHIFICIYIYIMTVRGVRG